MTEEKTQIITNQILNQILNSQTSWSIKQVKEKFAFDIFLPRKVEDSTTGEETWTDSRTYNLFMTTANMEQKDAKEGWLQEKQELNSLDDIIKAWKKIDYMTTERIQNSINVVKSDTIYECENVYHSTNCSKCKNIVFCDSCANSDYILASQRSANLSFCLRVDDSVNCTNCYSVIFSNKVSNSYFIQDCFNISECMFCSHLVGVKYCICNMQFEKEEYLFYKEKIIEWIINS